jgi:hypothetical protein
MQPVDFNRYGFDLVFCMTEVTQGREVARGKTGIVFIDPARAPSHPHSRRRAAQAAARRPNRNRSNMTTLHLFLPCAGGVEDFLADEVHGLTGLAGDDLLTLRGGVRVRGDWAVVLPEPDEPPGPARAGRAGARAVSNEHELYAWQPAWRGRLVHAAPELSGGPDGQASPLKSLNFATLRIKDAVADRFRQQAGGVRPSIDTQRPDVRVQAHLTPSTPPLHRHQRRAPVQARLAPGQGRGAAEGNPGRRHAGRQRLVAAGHAQRLAAAAVRPLLRLGHHRHRGRAAGPGPARRRAARCL